MASQKFDALFGGPEPNAAATNNESHTGNIDPALAEALAPNDSAAGQGNDNRKQSNVSTGSANRKLSAIFGRDDQGADQKPRKRFTKEQLLNRFKQTTQLDMTVFEPDRIIDYADLFISKGKKPTFTNNKAEADEERDPFDDMMDEAVQKESEADQQEDNN